MPSLPFSKNRLFSIVSESSSVPATDSASRTSTALTGKPMTMKLCSEPQAPRRNTRPFWMPAVSLLPITVAFHTVGMVCGSSVLSSSLLSHSKPVSASAGSCCTTRNCTCGIAPSSMSN
jgi:hypothetical protein